MKVLHIISGNDNGGGGNHVVNLCSCSEPVMESTIGCIGGGPLYEKAKNSSISTVLFSMKSILKDLPQYVKENNIDIIDFHGAKPFLIYRLIKNKLTKPAVATVHSDYRYDFLNSKLKYFIFTPLSTIGLRSFKHYICVSQYIKNILSENGFKGNKFVVNNGIDFENIYVKTGRNEIRRSLCMDDSDFAYICVARLHPIKNHKMLLEAFTQLRSEFKDVKLILVGDGVLEAELKELASKFEAGSDVIFTGYKSNSIDYVNASDVSILVSLNEGGAPPLSVLESAAVKKAVIATCVGDLQYVLNGENGFLIETNSIENIYSKMKEAYLNKAKLDAVGEKLYELVKKDFTMNSFRDKYYRSYMEILEEDKKA